MGSNGFDNDRGSIITEAEWKAIGERFDIPPRQVQVVQAFIAGHGKPAAIAKHLKTKPSTVKTHIERLYGNLKVHGRVQAVVKVLLEILRMREGHRP